MEFKDQIEQICIALQKLPEKEKIEQLNNVRSALHEVSPFANEPVDCVLWQPSGIVEGNPYNPNQVAPPEMRLLKLSIDSDGVTQPVVVWDEHRDGSKFVVVDGFHRTRVLKEVKEMNKRVHGYIPVSIIRSDREDVSDRMAATIRHNRARGAHTVSGMSEIVVELKRRNHSDAWIAKQLGMDRDEVLRLSQISGLAEMFADKEFSEAWEVG